MRKKMTLFISLSIIYILSASLCFAETGVTRTTIKIGTITDLSGPAAFYGKGIIEGASLYFKYINDNGGIHGRKIEYAVEDDGYQAPRAVQACKKLVTRDQVFCLFMITGSVQINAVYPFLKYMKVPCLLPGTQSRSLTIPPRKYLFQAGTTISTQGKQALEFVVDDLKIKKPKVACLYQDDGPGHDWRRGVKIAARHYELDVLDLPYKRGASDFSSQIARCKDAGITHILMYTLVREPALIMKEAERLQYRAAYVSSTFSASNKVIHLIGDTIKSTNGFYATSLINDPLTVNNKTIKEYKSNIKKYRMCSLENFGNVYGYQSAVTLVEGLKRAGKNLTREGIIKAFETFKNYDNGLFAPTTFSPNNRTGSKAVKVYRVIGGYWKAQGGWRFSKIKED